MLKRLMLLALGLGSLASAQFVAAGPFADDMAKCMVTTTSAADRTVLVKWIFSIITLHPDLTSLTILTLQQRDEITQNAGLLMQRLLTESCRTQTQLAFQNEGPQVLEYAFQVLGQVASRGMLSDPHVAAAARYIAKYMDQNKLDAVTGGAVKP